MCVSVFLCAYVCVCVSVFEGESECVCCGGGGGWRAVMSQASLSVSVITFMSKRLRMFVSVIL